MISAQPEPLVFIARAVTQLRENELGVFAALKMSAQHQFIHEVWRTNRDFSEEPGTIKEKEHQLEEPRIARPHFVERRTRTVGAHKRIEPRDDAVGVGENCGL